MRRAHETEEAAIRDSLNAIDRRAWDRIVGDDTLALFGEPLQVAVVPAAAWDLPVELVQAAAGALVIGEWDEGFRLDLQGARLLAEMTEKQTVRVQERAARLFLYGRDILGQSVLEYDGSLHKGAYCIVTNPRGEALGIGEVVGRLKGGGRAVRAVHDLGSYLRDQ